MKKPLPSDLTPTAATHHTGPKKFRKNYEPSNDPGIFTPEETRTKQSFKDECDINNIVRKPNLPELIAAGELIAQYGDFSDMPTYHEAQNIVANANAQFALLPAETRERFQNNPAKFLAFANDPKSGPEMVRLGLAKAVRVDTPSPASPTPPKAGQADPKPPASKGDDA